MKLNGRRQGIMDMLLETGTASVDDLSARFGVSKMTIHRDLDELEEGGLLRKVRGGASIQSSGPVRERLPLPPDARRRGEGPDRRRRRRGCHRARPDGDDRRRLDGRRHRARTLPTCAR